MALRAEQWMMLGIGAIGLGAAYLLTRTSKEQNGSQANGTLGPGSPNLPEKPVAVGPLPPTVTVISGNPIHLRNSRSYRGRIETISADGRIGFVPFSPGSSKKEIADGLRQLGFENVQVYATPEEAKGMMPDYALPGAGRGTRWFYGRYLGSTADIPRPQTLSLIWETKGLNQV